MEERERKASRRESANKLDSIIIPLLGATGLFFSTQEVADANAEAAKVAGIAFLVALFAHYLSIESEARVFDNRNSKKRSRLFNSATRWFNLFRLIAFVTGFVALIIVVVRS